MFNFPKNTSEYLWTAHSVFKMRQYGLSEQRVKNVIKRPKRKEEGIVKNTVAVMQPVSAKIINGKEIWKQEIWVMFQKRGTRSMERGTKVQNRKQIKIISAWRYPGVSPKNNPIPEEILEELGNIK
ncbi:MAG: hypothetical protein A2288_00720 [Candidatus Moranbacteria bacterium RIFOXYA12_FULL_44_15]|nr:MAG: hypothetical protein A2288_00720 [Candidatus Moranbacteria bacterium RIFOXYA12_FULL_44_15]OGI35054.1 MAG: hypothetical protein A2259_04735 [Candidatus Moranbacteria bacterium RIFOXYA2_FULL_43_15]